MNQKLLSGPEVTSYLTYLESVASSFISFLGFQRQSMSVQILATDDVAALHFGMCLECGAMAAYLKHSTNTISEDPLFRCEDHQR